MAAEDKEQVWNQKLAQGALRTIAVRVAAPATGANSEIALAQIIAAAAQATAGIVSPTVITVVRASFIPDVAVSAAGGSTYGTLSIGQRAAADATAGTDLTGTLSNIAAKAAFVEHAIVTTAQTIAAGQVLTLKNTVTSTGGAWQAGVVVLTIQM